MILSDIFRGTTFRLGEMELRVAEKATHHERRCDARAGIVTLDDAGIDAAEREVLEAVEDRKEATAEISRVAGFGA